MNQLGEVLGKLFGGQESGLMQQLSGLLQNSGGGGLAGLLEQFKTNGMDKEVQSWVGKDKNVPVSGEQLEKVLGKERMSKIAASMGTNVKEASSKLAKALPEAVDKATPEGRLPTSAEFDEMFRNWQGGGK